jgi:membrane-associated protease RseP (regulator of RpoE activity)
MKEFKLDNEPKITSGFKVPESYFENLENGVQKKIGEKEIRVISLITKKNWIIAVAAVFVIALSIPIVNYMNASTSTIDQVQLETYLTEQSNLSEDDIVELLDEEKIQKIKLELNVNTNELEEALLTNSNLEDYLIN